MNQNDEGHSFFMTHLCVWCFTNYLNAIITIQPMIFLRKCLRWVGVSTKTVHLADDIRALSLTEVTPAISSDNLITHLQCEVNEKLSSLVS